jgi:hypothetical protein
LKSNNLLDDFILGLLLIIVISIFHLFRFLRQEYHIFHLSICKGEFLSFLSFIVFQEFFEINRNGVLAIGVFVIIIIFIIALFLVLFIFVVIVLVIVVVIITIVSHLLGFIQHVFECFVFDSLYLFSLKPES